MKIPYAALKNSVIVIVASLILSILLSHIIPPVIAEKTVGILYTVIGILFSVAMSIAISFDLSDIANDRYYFSIKKDLKKIVVGLIIGISVATLVYITPLQEFLTQATGVSYLFTPLSTLILISAWMLYIFYSLFEYKSDLSEHKRNSQK